MQGDKILPTQPYPEDNLTGIIIAEKNVPIEWNIGDIILDTYEVRDIFTSGGMGNVYRVHHRGWGMDLAVKSPKQEILNSATSIQNFVRECETWVNLGLHPHITSCYYVRNLGGIPRIFAEFIEGGSLRDWIDNGKLYEGGQQASLCRILDIAIQMAWGLQYAHEQDLIHQDVKPANILMTSDGVAKVTDFGLAKARAIIGDVLTPGKSRTLIASVGGMTPAYCSPEQAAKSTLTRRTDIWSWAVTVLEMFTGEVFWLGGQFAAQALEESRRNSSTRSELPTMPKSIINILQECLLLDPEARPNSMMEVADRFSTDFQKITGQKFTRLRPEVVQMIADNLNNKAVSYIDMGLINEAKKTFEDLIKINPSHIEGIYNRSLFEWRTGRKTDEQIIREFEALALIFPDEWSVKLFLSYIHIERGDRQGALDALGKIDHKTMKDAHLIEAQKKAAELIDCHERLLSNIRGSTILELLPGHLFCLSGWEDNSLRIIDVESGEQTKVFQGFLGYDIQSMVFLPCGCTMFSAGDDGRIHQWDTEEGRRIRILEGHAFRITALTTIKSQTLISAGMDRTIRYWDIQTGKCIKEIFHKDFRDIFTLAYSSKGELLYVGGSKVLTLNRVTGEIIREYAWETPNGTYDNILTSLAFCTERNIAFVGTHQNGAFILDLATGSRQFLKGSSEDQSLTEHIKSVAISASGKYGLISSSPGQISLWDLESGIRLDKFKVSISYTPEVAFSPDEKYAALGEFIFPLGAFLAEVKNNSNRPFQELFSKGFLRYFCNRKSSVSRVSFSVDSRLVAIGDHEGYIELWHLGDKYETGTMVVELASRQGLNQKEETIFDGHGGKINDLAISNDGKWALSASEDKTVCLWNLPLGKCVRVISHTQSVASVAISSDGRLGISGENSSGFPSPERNVEWLSDSRIYLWDLHNGERLRVFEGHKGHVSSLAFLDSSNLMLSSGADGNLRIWNTDTGLCSATLTGHDKGIRAVALSDDKSFAVSGCADGKLVGWNINTRKQIFVYDQQGFDISHIALSTKQDICVVGGEKREGIRVLQLSTGKCLRTYLQDTFYRISSIAIRNNQSIVVTTSDGRITEIPISRFEAMPYLVIRPQSSIEVGANKVKYKNLISFANQAFDSDRVGEAAKYLKQANKIPGYMDSVEWLKEWEQVSDKGIRTNLADAILLGSFPDTKLHKVKISPNDMYAFLLFDEYRLLNEYQLWNLNQCKLVRKLKCWIGSEKISLSSNSFDLSPSWRTGLFAGLDLKLEHGPCHNLLVLMDMKKWEACLVMEGHEDEIEAISISPNGKYALSGGKDRQIRLWNLATGHCLKVMVGHQEGVQFLTFSPNSLFGYSASYAPYDGCIKIWDLGKGTLHDEIHLPSLQEVEGYCGCMKDLAISENGMYLLVLVDLVGNEVLYIYHCKTNKWIMTISENSSIDSLEQSGIRPWDLFAGPALNLIMPIYRPGLRGHFSQSGKRAIITSDETSQQLIALKWDCKFPPFSDWDNCAFPYLTNFLTIHPPIRKGMLFKSNKFTWSRLDFQRLLRKLSHCGYGWLRPEGVQHQLEKMARDWKGPPQLFE